MGGRGGRGAGDDGTGASDRATRSWNGPAVGGKVLEEERVGVRIRFPRLKGPEGERGRALAAFLLCGLS